MVVPEGRGFPEMTYAATINGWMQTDVFENFFKGCFLKAIGDERPLLIIYDGHATHVGLGVIRSAKDAGITILKLPPHSSHLLQPLDLSVMKSLKVRWDQVLMTWQRKNIGAKIPKGEFSALIGEIWKDLNEDIIKNGFKKAGIFPFDQSIIPEEMFDNSALRRWKSSCQNLEREVTPPINATSSVNIPVTSESTPGPSTRQDDQDNGVSFEQLMLGCLKRGSEVRQKRKKICEGAEIITGEEVIDRLISQEEEKVNIKKQKDIKKKKRIVVPEEPETSEDDNYSTKSSDDEGLESVIQEEIDSYNYIVEQKDVEQKETGDWVIVKFPLKKNNKYFVGQITSFDDNEPVVKFVRKISQSRSTTTFKFPDVEDESLVSSDDIISILPKPTVGRRGELWFNVVFDSYNIQ